MSYRHLNIFLCLLVSYNTCSYSSKVSELEHSQSRNVSTTVEDQLLNDGGQNWIADAEASRHDVRNRRDIMFVDEDHSAGSFCYRKYDNAPGYCVNAYRCSQVIEDYKKKGILPDICSYEGQKPIVCCPTDYMIDIRVKPDEATPTSLTPRISAYKCEEYNKLASKKISVLPLSLDEVVHDYYIPKCSSSIPLIVGGEVTQPGEFPHMAAIGWTTTYPILLINWACGGTLISEYYVLTAAHCTILRGYPPDVVRLGEQNLKQSDSRANPQDISIVEVIKHPNYKTNFYYYDIALLRLAEKPDFTIFVRPACLWPYPNFNFTESLATGWGKISVNGIKSDELRKVGLQFIDNNVCNMLYSTERKIPDGILDSQICAGYLEGGKDTCQGDSGGPLQIIQPNSKCTYFIIGVTSFGKFCAAPDAPGVYTKIYPYLDWIEGIAFKN